MIRKKTAGIIFGLLSISVTSLSTDLRTPWPLQIKRSDEKIADYLAKNPQNYNWHAQFATGKNGIMGIPFVLFRLLPELDPTTWGSPEENFAKFGFWLDERTLVNGQARPLPMGFGWTGSDDLSARNTFGTQGSKLSMVTRTCSSCHTQRLRLDDGSYKYLEGAPNTEMQLHLFKAAKMKFFLANLDPKNISAFKERVFNLIDDKHNSDANWFFKNWYGYSAEVEAQEIRDFKANIDEILAKIYLNARGSARVEQRLVKYNYDPSNPLKFPYHAPMPGFMDTNGAGQAGFTVKMEDEDPKVKFFFAGGSSKSDVPPIWRQSDLIVNHWSGFLKDNFFRNVTAALGIVGGPENIDPKISYSQSQFVNDLPSPKYPFEVDLEKARRGRKLFVNNCQGCHRSHHDQSIEKRFVFPQIKTDKNLLNSNTAFGFVTLAKIMKEMVCAKDIEVSTGDKKVYPGRIDFDKDFAVFRTTNPNAADVKMVFKEQAPLLEEAGYVARPLHGIWAQSPYFHNGSVATLRQVIMPKLRPQKFVRGSLSFDKENVGFKSDINELEELKKLDPGVAVFDTSYDGHSNVGHDFEVIGVPGKPGKYYRLNWDDTPTQADELLEYLKTL